MMNDDEGVLIPPFPHQPLNANLLLDGKVAFAKPIAFKKPEADLV